MAEDFGDYSGEKLFDWVMRMGQEAGGSAAMEAADRLKEALENARRGVGSQGRDGTGPEAEGPAQWAKLDMREFTSIEGWPTLQELIGGKLDGCGIAHDWYRDGEDRTYLLFRADDATELVRAFGEMSQDVDAAKERASAELSAGIDRAKERAREIGHDHGRNGRVRTGADERLADKAEMAKAAAEELRRDGRGAPEREKAFDHERAQGR